MGGTEAQSNLRLESSQAAEGGAAIPKSAHAETLLKQFGYPAPVSAKSDGGTESSPDLTRTHFQRSCVLREHFQRLSTASGQVRPELTTLCLLLMILGLFGGCARNPVTGRPEAVFTSEKGEIKQGQAAAKEVENKIGFLEDPELQSYVNSLGQRLAAQSPRTHLDHEFRIVPMAEPNAFALPGGHIYISRGLLADVNSEDELANVIGHEIGHVAARHSVSRQTARAPLIPVQIIAGLGGAAAGIVSPQMGRVVSGVGQLPGSLALSAYSRDQEREADRLGQQFASAAGFDPMAMATFMKTLTREEDLASQKSEAPSFLRDHPSSPERAKDAIAYAETLKIATDQPPPLSRAQFLQKLDGLPVGAMASEGVFLENRFLHADLNFTIEFPAEWEPLNTPEAVAALQPQGLGQIVLQIVAEGSDPLAEAERFSQEVSFDAPVQTLELNHLSATRATATFGSALNRLRALITWIEYDGRIYQISGVTTRRHFVSMKEIFRVSENSFSPLTANQKAEVKQNTLRVARAEGGEDLETLTQRTGNQWSLEQTAIANEIKVGTPLKEGSLIKIVIAEPYRGRPTPLSKPAPSASEQ